MQLSVSTEHNCCLLQIWEPSLEIMSRKKKKRKKKKKTLFRNINNLLSLVHCLGNEKTKKKKKKTVYDSIFF